MKRQNSSPFPEKNTAFLLDVSLHFRPFVVRYGITMALINPPERKMAKRISVHCAVAPIHIGTVTATKEPHLKDR